VDSSQVIGPRGYFVRLLNLQTRYSARVEPFDNQSGIERLPDNWTVVTITTTEDASSLLVTRQRPNRDPLILCIPLERHGRKDEDEDQQLSYADAIKEFRKIITA
jgi:Peptidase family C50